MTPTPYELELAERSLAGSTFAAPSPGRRERDRSLSHRRLGILVSLDGAAADDSSSMRLILKTSETFVRHGL